MIDLIANSSCTAIKMGAHDGVGQAARRPRPESVITDRYHVLGLAWVRRPFKTFRTVSPSIPHDFAMRRLSQRAERCPQADAVAGTFSWGACTCPAMPPATVTAVPKATASTSPPTGQRACSWSPARSHTGTVRVATAADRGPPVRADRHRGGPAVVAGEHPRRARPGPTPAPCRRG
jgi:hypothetical protein